MGTLILNGVLCAVFSELAYYYCEALRHFLLVENSWKKGKLGHSFLGHSS